MNFVNELHPTRRLVLTGLLASVTSPVFASSSRSQSFKLLERHVEEGRGKFEYEEIVTGCIDPRHVGVRALAGGDVCLLTAGLALLSHLETHSMHHGLTCEAIFSAAAETVGGEHNFCRHTDRIHLAKGASPKGVDGCLFCTLWAKYPQSFLFGERERDALFEYLLAMKTNSQVYEGDSSPHGLITIRQDDYTPGGSVWGVDGTVMIDGVRQQLFVNHETLGEQHLRRYASFLLNAAHALRSRMPEDECCKRVLAMWRAQTAETIRRKFHHHPKMVRADLTFQTSGDFRIV
jgi:hypothetical protein